MGTIFDEKPLRAAEIAAKVPGLTIVPQYISADEEAALMAAIDGGEWLTDLPRRVQHFGYRYDYRAKRLNDELRVGPLPAWAADLAARVHADGFMPTIADQVIVNDYAPGQGIANHVDCVPCFGPVVVSLSLLSRVVMKFLPLDAGDAKGAPSRETGGAAGGEGPGEWHLILEPRALLVMAGDARYRWKHGIGKRKFDQIDYRKVPRQRRVSITLRTVILSPE